MANHSTQVEITRHLRSLPTEDTSQGNVLRACVNFDGINYNVATVA